MHTLTWMTQTAIMLNERSQIDTKECMVFKNKQVIEIRIVVPAGKGIMRKASRILYLGGSFTGIYFSEKNY